MWPRTSLPRVTTTTSPVSRDRKSTRLNSSHANISYAVFCLKKKNNYIFLCILYSFYFFLLFFPLFLFHPPFSSLLYLSFFPLPTLNPFLHSSSPHSLIYIFF